VKPGDLVYIIDHGGYYSTDPPKIGLIIGFDDSPMLVNSIQVLKDGEVKGYSYYELRLVNDDGEDYDGTRENK
jgi:hypothetical protein